MLTHRMDNPVWASLSGRHAGLARRAGDALWYDQDHTPFVAVDDVNAKVVDDGALRGRRYFVGVAPTSLPDNWIQLETTKYHATPDTLQFVRPLTCPGFEPVEGVSVLGPADWNAMSSLTAKVYPEFFRRRTPELGTYMGVIRDGELLAMAGERMALPGAVEISAVCTHPDHLGKGLAGTVMRALINRHRAAGLVSFLHVSTGNDSATRLYEKLGFELRTVLRLTAVDIV